MISDNRMLRLKRSTVLGAKIALVVAILLVVGRVPLLKAAISSAVVILFFATPSLLMMFSDFVATRASTGPPQLAEPLLRPSSRWLLIVLIQIVNAVLMFFLLMLSAGGDHADNFDKRGAIAIIIFCVTTVVAFALRGGRGIAIALLAVPLLLMFAWRV